MSKKLYDLAVKTGEYTNQQGETKGKWQNIGACLESDEGNKFILIDRWFNPAGLPNPENRSNIMVSMFKPKDNQQQSAPPAQDPDDDIPW